MPGSRPMARPRRGLANARHTHARGPRPLAPPRTTDIRARDSSYHSPADNGVPRDPRARELSQHIFPRPMPCAPAVLLVGAAGVEGRARCLENVDISERGKVATSRQISDKVQLVATIRIRRGPAGGGGGGGEGEASATTTQRGEHLQQQQREQREQSSPGCPGGGGGGGGGGKGGSKKSPPQLPYVAAAAEAAAEVEVDEIKMEEEEHLAREYVQEFVLDHLDPAEVKKEVGFEKFLRGWCVPWSPVFRRFSRILHFVIMKYCSTIFLLCTRQCFYFKVVDVSWLEPFSRLQLK